MVKNPRAMQELWVRSLGQEGPVEKEMTTHSSILAGKSHGQRCLAGWSVGSQRVRHGLATKQQQSFLLKCNLFECKDFYLFFLMLSSA